MNRPIAGLTGALHFGWAQVTGAQTIERATPPQFAAAAAACMTAVSPDKLDAAKLGALGWIKQSDQQAPFGAAAVYGHAESPVRIYVIAPSTTAPTKVTFELAATDAEGGGDTSKVPFDAPTENAAEADQ